MLESDYTHADSPKPPPEVPLRVFLKSQLMAALRQHARPIIIEGPGPCPPVHSHAAGAGVAPEDGRRPRSRSDVICDQPVLWRRHRSALVHRPIRPSGQRAASYLKAEGTSATYAEHCRLGGFREVPSIDRGSCLFGAQHGGMALPASIASASDVRSRPLKHWLARVANSPAGDYARSDSANCSRADATLQCLVFRLQRQDSCQLWQRYRAAARALLQNFFRQIAA